MISVCEGSAGGRVVVGWWYRVRERSAGERVGGRWQAHAGMTVLYMHTGRGTPTYSQYGGIADTESRCGGIVDTESRYGGIADTQSRCEEISDADKTYHKRVR